MKKAAAPNAPLFEHGSECIWRQQPDRAGKRRGSFDFRHGFRSAIDSGLSLRPLKQGVACRCLVGNFAELRRERWYRLPDRRPKLQADALAALGTTGTDHGATTAGGHANQEAVGTLAADN